MATETMYQAAFVRYLPTAWELFYATHYWMDRKIPAMHHRGDAVLLLEFLLKDLPLRGVVLRFEVDLDSRRKVVDTVKVVDIVNVPHDTPLAEFAWFGDLDARDLRVWSRTGDPTSIKFPNVKEDADAV